MKRDVGGSHDPVPPNHVGYVSALYEQAKQFNNQPRSHRDPECAHLRKSLGMSQPILTNDPRFIECKHCVAKDVESGRGD